MQAVVWFSFHATTGQIQDPWASTRPFHPGKCVGCQFVVLQSSKPRSKSIVGCTVMSKLLPSELCSSMPKKGIFPSIPIGMGIGKFSDGLLTSPWRCSGSLCCSLDLSASLRWISATIVGGSTGWSFLDPDRHSSQACKIMRENKPNKGLYCFGSPKRTW